jgi:hypothetical protein
LSVLSVAVTRSVLSVLSVAVMRRVLSALSAAVTLVMSVALLSGAQTSQTNRVFTIPEPATVSVEITSGTITISGWDRAETSVDVATKGTGSGRTKATEPVFEQNGSALRVAVLQPGDRPDPSLTTAVTIKAPFATTFDAVRVTRGRITLSGLRGVVSAKTEDGDVVASEMSGTMRLESTLGSVIVTGARATPGGLIRLRAFHGDVKLRLDPVPSDARILTSTFNGKISSDIPLRSKDGFGVRFAEATLGKGEPVISIDVVTGDVVITTGSSREVLHGGF